MGIGLSVGSFSIEVGAGTFLTDFFSKKEVLYLTNLYFFNIKIIFYLKERAFPLL